ncbi:GGDEF domain-containing protein [Marinimicrobium alkaliphilum]|uniref:GGDEF domain-containing protein n=1 Tax=Marinimicrobium alkaliphilum TaxID=2202654 RepID=UPI000DB97B1C|nr:GGDEF domain-containing protein [Marinimicrobium alkaliphilum]
MKSRSFQLLVILLIALTFVAIAAERFLPDRRLVLLPSEDLVLFLYSDGEEPNGNSEVTWIDESRHHFRCSVRPGANYLYCGFNLMIERESGEGIDLTGFDRLEMTLSHSGDSRHMVFFMRHYDERYSSLTDGNSSLYMSRTLLSEDVTSDLTLQLSEFKVADWWEMAHDIPRAMSQPAFGNVTVFGINFDRIGEHELRLDEIAVVGDWVTTEDWYLSILALWLSGALFMAFNRLAYLHRRNRRDLRRIQELAQLNIRLETDKDLYEKLAQHDALTGTLNRHGFNRIVHEILSRNDRATHSLILMDIDHFKAINDSAGHDAGDDILQELTRLIEANIRSNDYLGRWGGEEFIMFCAGSPLTNAYPLAEKLRIAINDTALTPDGSPLSASFGVAEFIPGERFESVFRRADKALYKAKREGRNQSVIATTTDQD